jgi:hypothetical protein
MVIDDELTISRVVGATKSWAKVPTVAPASFEDHLDRSLELRTQWAPA